MPRTTRKIKGGEIVSKFHYFPNQLYGSYDLKIVHKQALSLHHNKLNISLIADLNIDDDRRKQDIASIYLDKEDLTIVKLTQILDKYKINKPLNKEYFLQCTGWCWSAKLENTLLVGEALISNITIPIFLNDSDDGYFYDIDGNRYYLFTPLKTRTSPILNKEVYLFDTYNNVTQYGASDREEELSQSVACIKSDIDSGKQPDKEQIYNALGIYDDQQDIKYMFDRLRITNLQTTTIEECLLDYRTLRALNTDLSTYTDEGKDKMFYHSTERFNFFDYELISKSQSQWLSQIDNYPFKKCFFIGFTLNSPEKNKILPIFLKPDGWYSDGWNNYYPNFETIVITPELLSDSNLSSSEKKDAFTKGKNIQLNHDYLIGKIAYLFEPLATTTSINNILYNQYFTGQLLTNISNQVSSLAISGAVSSVSALTVGGLTLAAFGTYLFAGGGLLTWALYKAGYSTAKGISSLGYGNLDTYQKTLVDGGRKTQKKKKNKTIKKKKQHKKKTLYRRKK